MTKQQQSILDIIDGGDVDFVRFLAREAVTALAEISADLATERSEMARRAGNTATAALADLARRAPTLDSRPVIETRGPTDGH